MKQIEVAIEKVAFGGAGFGHVNGKACFVPFAVPGDLVYAKVTREKKSYMEASLMEVITASPDRISPVCPVFGDCGGCSLQQVSYRKQLEMKAAIFTEQLSRFAKVDEAVIAPIRESHAPWNYRTRVQIKVYWADGLPIIGFFRGGSHFVVPFPGCCAISSTVVNSVINELTSFLARSPETATIPQVDVATSDDGKAIVIVHYIGRHQDAIIRFLSDSHLSFLPSASGLWLQLGRKCTLRHIAGLETLSYDIISDSQPDLRLSFSKGGFCQVNFQQNQILVTIACEMSRLTGKERVLDLFCGNGNLTLPLAQRSSSVVGIEAYHASIQDAQANAVANQVRNITFICADAEAGVAGLVKNEEKFDVVVLDPPRTGAAPIMAYIPALQPERVVYVSCDPVTLARDIAILKKLDYSVVRSVPVDMFPQTSHIESVTLLERL
ncbi:23S rRNA (uracil(1939)-C(5))-methyltransferase RlmD [Geobacter pelophilus]|uniref:23S rRNA (Uracil(1939)-C(5))-methyltransferase RlmD n=1 Tax=Geoanaerobacter pelophilus TaxID=60036 RepID=A0AAW4L5A9_9BACT|nr:23S rRNA (uracil(1939)-C(5))-methyltransferase RlmD [Geoanaerobacter pelophilus]MBT0666409.1 23S rRNA (uracil(1939)-C(5))-methyltransferase RlmD [Geoanaerobacter pelophilus]